MNRCPNCLRATLLALCLSGLTSAGAQTLPARHFPPQALRGTLELTAPPDVVLDGKAARLSPGARIRATNNLITLPASLRGQTFTVNYLLDLGGLVHEVWILTPEEARDKRPTAASLR